MSFIDSQVTQINGKNSLFLHRDVAEAANFNPEYLLTSGVRGIFWIAPRTKMSNNGGLCHSFLRRIFSRLVVTQFNF